MTTVTSELWPALRRDVSREALQTTATDLVSWHRHSGTYGEYQAVDYLLERLASLDIAAEAHAFDGYISNPLAASLTIQQEGRPTVRALTHPFSANAPAGVRGEVVAASGDGDGVDMAGKIVLVDGPGTPFTVNQWLHRGAVGLICHSHARVVQDYIISGVWGTPDPSSARTLPDIPVVSVDDATGSDLRRRLAAGPVEVTLRAQVDTGIKPLRFPMAYIPAGVETDEFILLAGHLDSWYAGAMDNAAGDAALLEAARVLNEHRGELRRNVRIAWWVGHSHGRFAASTWYCDTHWHDLTRNCVGYLNVDQPGHEGATFLRCFATPDSRRFLVGMVDALAGRDAAPALPPRNADQSFLGAGLPSFSYLPRLEPGSADEAPDAIGDNKPWYQHTPEDTIDHLDFDLLAEQTYYYCATMMELSRRPLLPWDHADLAQAFLDRLQDLVEAGGTALDLSGCVAAAEDLRAEGTRLRTLDGAASDAPGELNRAILRVSQLLLPVYFSSGGRYHQGPATNTPTLPRLAELPRLMAAPAGSEERLFLTTRLRREANRVQESLRRATEELAAALGDRGGAGGHGA